MSKLTKNALKALLISASVASSALAMEVVYGPGEPHDAGLSYQDSKHGLGVTRRTPSPAVRTVPPTPTTEASGVDQAQLIELLVQFGADEALIEHLMQTRASTSDVLSILLEGLGQKIKAAEEVHASLTALDQSSTEIFPPAFVDRVKRAVAYDGRAEDDFGAYLSALRALPVGTDIRLLVTCLQEAVTLLPAPDDHERVQTEARV